MIDTSKAFIGMTRTEMKQIFGEPTDIGRGTRKYPTPSVYRYGRIEFGFAGHGLFYLMDTGESGEEHIMILQESKNENNNQR